MSSFLGGGGGGTTFPPMVDTGIVYVPNLTDGFSYTIPDNKWHVVFNGTLGINNGTITMPANPIDGQIIRLKTMQNIQALDVLPNVGQIVNDHPGILPEFTYFEATYDAALSTWYIEYFSGALITLIQDLTLYVCILAGNIVGGSLYISGTYTDVPLTGGSGAGAKANIIVTGGVVTDVIPTAQGTGYLIGDVLSASNVNLGGSGSGFTFTLTGVGNDLQKGTTLSTAFRTLTRADQELGVFNWALGFAGAVNVSHGQYDERVIFSTLVGTSPEQITWTGDIASRDSVIIKPTTNTDGFGTGDPIFNFFGSIGHFFQGFWLDATDPGFFGWEIYRASGGSDVSIRTCRLSQPNNNFWNLQKINGSHAAIGDWTVDFPGTQACFAVLVDGALDFDRLTSITLLSAAPTFPPGNYFFEMANSQVFVNMDPTGWIGWGGTVGQQFSIQNNSSILTLFAQSASIPGTVPGSFTNSNCYYGADFHSSVDLAVSNVNHGIPERGPTLPTVGDGGDVPGPDSWAIFDVIDNSGTDHAYILVINNFGTAVYHGLGSLNKQTASYQLKLSDLDGRVEVIAAGANTITVPTNATVPFPVDAEITVTQGGVGATTIVAAGGVTGHNFGTLTFQWASAKLYQRAIDEWVMTSV